jgi:hypothetical protein
MIWNCMTNSSESITEPQSTAEVATRCGAGGELLKCGRQGTAPAGSDDKFHPVLSRTMSGGKRIRRL